MQGKAEHNAEKPRQSAGFKAKLNEDLCCGSPSPNNRKKKVLTLSLYILLLYQNRYGGKKYELNCGIYTFEAFSYVIYE